LPSSLWWTASPIRSDFIYDRHNCECFNGKLRDECLNQKTFYGWKEAQIVVEQWRKRYNTIHPHSSLNHRPLAPQTSASNSIRWIGSHRCSGLSGSKNHRSANLQAGAQNSQSPVDAEEGGDGSSMLFRVRRHWSILLTFTKLMIGNLAGHVCSGSFRDLAARNSEVRFAPINRHRQLDSSRPKKP
jgi:hypothetical protein